jgi:hypothetical protein
VKSRFNWRHVLTHLAVWVALELIWIVITLALGLPML